MLNSFAEKDLLEEKANTNSPNSDVPTSTEMIKPDQNKSRTKKNNQRGGQQGHKGFQRKLTVKSPSLPLIGERTPIAINLTI